MDIHAPPPSNSRANRSGFTLVELSIVLVIIGLIIGGVLVGSTLIESATKNKLISELNSYKVAYNTYRLKYDVIPGDHVNATDYWSTQTENGDGDGNIFDHSDGDEDMQAMQHLALAGFIKHGYFSSYWPQVVGDNVPQGPFPQQGYRFESVPWNTGSLGETLYGRTGNGLAAGTAATGDIWGEFLTTAQAQSIDTKMDDGKPATGNVVSNNWGSPTDCITGSSDYNDPGQNQYNFSNTAIACNIVYWMDF